MSAPPRIGQRVRFTRDDHPFVSPGRSGMIDRLGPDNQFVVLTDCGGFFGWTTFASWEPTGEPDETRQVRSTLHPRSTRY